MRLETSTTGTASAWRLVRTLAKGIGAPRDIDSTSSSVLRHQLDLAKGIGAQDRKARLTHANQALRAMPTAERRYSMVTEQAANPEPEDEPPVWRYDAEKCARWRNMIKANEQARGVTWDPKSKRYRAKAPAVVARLPVSAGVKDEKLLFWFFNESLSSQLKSTFGLQCAQADRFQHRERLCPECFDPDRGDSSGINTETGEWCSKCDGNGRIEPKRIEPDEHPQFATDTCRRCAGTGVNGTKRRYYPSENLRRYREVKRREPFPDNDTMPRGDGTVCPFCDGNGYVEKLSARILSAGNDEGGVEPSEQDLRNYGPVWRRLNRMTPEHRRTLELFFGPHGERYAAEIIRIELNHRLAHDKAVAKGEPPPERPITGAEPQRIFAVYPSTPSGHRIIRNALQVSNNRTTHALSEHHLLENEWAADRLKSNSIRGRLFRMAQDEAHRAVGEALAAWAKAGE